MIASTGVLPVESEAATLRPAFQLAPVSGKSDWARLVSASAIQSPLGRFG